MDRKTRRLVPTGVILMALMAGVGMGRAVLADEVAEPPRTEEPAEMAAPELGRHEPLVTPTPEVPLLPGELVDRAFDLGAQLGEVEHRLVELGAEDPTPERQELIAKLHADADDIRAERERLSRLAEEVLAGEPPRIAHGDRHLEVLALEHRDALDVAEIIRRFLPPESEVVADPGTNKIILLSWGAGIDVARRLVEELDAPVPREARVPYEPERRRQSSAHPTYDYERAVSQGDVGEELRDRAPKAFQRTTGKLVEKSDTSITILPDGAEEPQTLQIPQVQVGADEWRVEEPYARMLEQAEVGDRVVVEWWEADAVRYVEGIAHARPEASEETYILRR